MSTYTHTRTRPVIVLFGIYIWCNNIYYIICMSYLLLFGIIIVFSILAYFIWYIYIGVHRKLFLLKVWRSLATCFEEPSGRTVWKNRWEQLFRAPTILPLGKRVGCYLLIMSIFKPYELATPLLGNKYTHVLTHIHTRVHMRVWADTHMLNRDVFVCTNRWM